MENMSDVFAPMVKWMTDFFGDIGNALCKNAGRVAGSVLKALIILIIGWWVASLLSKAAVSLMNKGKVDVGIRSFAASCVKIGVRLLVLVSAIAALGINITSLIAALGAAGITLGLAMKDSLSNFASGVLILFNRPFVVGDIIEFENSLGTVERIELMYTVLRSPDNKVVIHPNSTITAKQVINYTALGMRRMDITLPVCYESDIDAVRRAAMQVCAQSGYIDSGSNNTLVVKAFSDSAIELELHAWVKAKDYLDACYDTRERLLGAVRENGITIPFSQLDVHVINDK